MTKEEMLYMQISSDIEIDKEIDKYFADRIKREAVVISNQEITAKFKKLFKKKEIND